MDKLGWNNGMRIHKHLTWTHRSLRKLQGSLLWRPQTTPLASASFIMVNTARQHGFNAGKISPLSASSTQLPDMVLSTLWRLCSWTSVSDSRSLGSRWCFVGSCRWVHSLPGRHWVGPSGSWYTVMVHSHLVESKLKSAAMIGLYSDKVKEGVCLARR